ncbi:hypothetical protein ACFW0I_22470 [[Kitasatospora] papulosa]|uniref:hypothetical protein n=1 Tax=[Kitasatospora] papulosa TaxID=1464011 RepID=UPI0036B53C93
MIGVDTHKSSHTTVAIDAAGHQMAQRRFVVNAGTFRQLMRWCEQWLDRRFAVEGAGCEAFVAGGDVDSECGVGPAVLVMGDALDGALQGDR